MNNEPIMHTLANDIEEELRKKDANILANTIEKKLEDAPAQIVTTPTNTPNYTAFIISMILAIIFIIGGYIIWLKFGSVSNTTITQETKNAATNLASSTKSADGQVLAGVNIIPRTYNSLAPYIELKEYKKDSVIFTIKDYEGLNDVLLYSEKGLTDDFKRYFKIDDILGPFNDISYMNHDLRIASSTLIVATSSVYVPTTTMMEIIATSTATITDYKIVKGKKIKFLVATTTYNIESVPTTSMIETIQNIYGSSSIIYGFYNREYIIFARDQDLWMQTFNSIID